jgi:hypothetical protein
MGYSADEISTGSCKVGQFKDALTGACKSLSWQKDNPQILSQDYFLGIAEGDVSGHSLFSKIGYTAGCTTTETDVWVGATAYQFPASAMQMEVVSSSANDASTSTGVGKVRIYYLKDDYTEATTDVWTNGTTPVATTVNDIYRVNNFRVVSFGATTQTYKAIGKIDVRHVVTDASVYSSIAIGQTRARNSVYTVPHGKTLYITSMAVGFTKTSTTGNPGIATLRATYDDKANSLLTAGLFFMPYAEINHQDGMYSREFHVPLRFPAHTDLKVSVLCNQSATVATSSIRGWLE